MDRTVLLEVFSPDKVLFKDEILSLVCVAEKGKLGILPGHANLIARLRPGILNIKDKSGKTKDIELNGGFLRVQPHHITILVE